MSMVTLRDAIDDLERRLAQTPATGPARPGPWLYAEEEDDDLYGEDDLGFDDIDEDDRDEDDLDDDLDEDELDDDIEEEEES